MMISGLMPKNIPGFLPWFSIRNLLLSGILFLFSSSCFQVQDQPPPPPAHHPHYYNGKRNHYNQRISSQAPESNAQVNASGAIPEKVTTVLQYIVSHGEAMPGYVGGRKFGNFEHRLPQTNASGQAIEYQEWDVNPHEKGVNRGTERLITSTQERKAYFTQDHYQNFTEIPYPNQ